MPAGVVSVWKKAVGIALALTGAVAPMDQAAAQQESARFEVVALLQQAPGNIAVTADGRIVVSQHQFYDPVYRVVEVMDDGSTQPFPNEEWASAPGPDGRGMVAVLGIRADPAGVVWMLDNGSRPPRLIGWDLNADQLAKVIPIPPPAAPEASFLNDFALDTINRAVYIADIGQGPTGGAIVVVDLDTGQARRVLAGHALTSAEDVRMVIDDRPVQMRGADGEVFEPRVAINPITIDALAEWVYFGAMSGTSLYRVRAADLRDAGLSEEALAKRVERFGPKPVSDGISMDGAGNVYVTDVEASGIGVTRPDGRYELLFSDKERLSWPESISAGPDNNMYVAVNKLHLSAKLNAGENEPQPPYYIVRFPALDPTLVGR